MGRVDREVPFWWRNSRHAAARLGANLTSCACPLPKWHPGPAAHRTATPGCKIDRGLKNGRIMVARDSLGFSKGRGVNGTHSHLLMAEWRSRFPQQQMPYEHGTFWRLIETAEKLPFFDACTQRRRIGGNGSTLGSGNFPLTKSFTARPTPFGSGFLVSRRVRQDAGVWPRRHQAI
jgi:hypothetical protein